MGAMLTPVRVQMHYHNIVADLLGCRGEDRQVAPGTTLRTLLGSLAAENVSFGRLAPAEEGHAGQVRVFRNGQLAVDLDLPLAEGDELRLFPVVSGG